MLDNATSFAAFKDSWLEDVRADSPNTVALGSRFANKLVAQWLEVDDDSLDVVRCDGAGDGGIDIAVLVRGDEASDDDEPESDTWYLVQSKYGTAFSGEGTLLREGQKVIQTLAGERTNLSSLTENLLERLRIFRAQAGEHDRIRLVYATVDPLTETQRKTLADVLSMGRERLGVLFDVEAVSLQTIYDAQQDEAALAAERKRTVPLRGSFTTAGSALLVGAVSLIELYDFLKAYRNAAGQIDQLFDKNVRRFLGGRVKVNKGMQKTLREEPELFGLFNNGITITVSDFSSSGASQYDLVEPLVVNGCQTTRTIWEVLETRLDAGGKGASAEIDGWRERLGKGCIVTKVAKVGSNGEELLHSITRYTNSQNAVREKDFISIDRGFKAWHDRLAKEHDLYLEIQRGGADSQRAVQKQNPSTKQFTRFANAHDLIKVYGAGWMNEPGLAFGQNKPFLPGGAIYERMVNRPEDKPPFGAPDLYAAWLLQLSGKAQGFGRGGQPARRQTKFLYYFTFVTLLRSALSAEGKAHDAWTVTEAVRRILEPKTDVAEQLEQLAAGMIDSYFDEGDDNGVQAEEAYTRLNADLNAFLKWNKLGRSLSDTPKLQTQIEIRKHMMMAMPGPDGTVLRKSIAATAG